MSLGFFIIGGIIFAVYMYLTIWNIKYSNKKQKEENYPNLGGEGCDLPEFLKDKPNKLTKN